MAKEGLFSDGVVSEERLLAALERIAMSLEVLSGLGRPETPQIALDGTSQGEESAVSYVDDREELRKEVLRDDYYSRTGIRLPPGEDPPQVPAAYFERARTE